MNDCASIIDSKVCLTRSKSGRNSYFAGDYEQPRVSDDASMVGGKVNVTHGRSVNGYDGNAARKGEGARLTNCDGGKKGGESCTASRFKVNKDKKKDSP